MKTKVKTFTIAKEDIHHVQFSKQDVLINKSQQKKRSEQLTRAAKLGNLLHNKVSIFFMDKNNRLMRVNTTVWAVTKKFVVLKNATTIPLERIVGIE